MIPRSSTPLANEALMELGKVMEHKLTLGDAIATIDSQFNRSLFRSAKLGGSPPSQMDLLVYYLDKALYKKLPAEERDTEEVMSDVRAQSVLLSRIGKTCEREMWMAY
ncbi:hypothetical protein PG984_009828 [Apiospora sp. TS-2023a]